MIRFLMMIMLLKFIFSSFVCQGCLALTVICIHYMHWKKHVTCVYKDRFLLAHENMN